MAQYVPPVLANGDLYNQQQQVPVPRPVSPSPYGTMPPHPGPRGIPTQPMLASLLAGHYPVHDFYGQVDPKRNIQLQALLNLLAQYRAY